VSVELLLKGADGVIKVVKLALEVSGVVGAARGHVWGGHHRLYIEAPSVASRAWLAVALT